MMRVNTSSLDTDEAFNIYFIPTMPSKEHRLVVEKNNARRLVGDSKSHQAAL